MLSQEHFIICHTTLNIPFTNNFETNGAPYKTASFIGSVVERTTVVITDEVSFYIRATI